jgi:hypothetical protein
MIPNTTASNPHTVELRTNGNRSENSQHRGSAYGQTSNNRTQAPDASYDSKDERENESLAARARAARTTTRRPGDSAQTSEKRNSTSSEHNQTVSGTLQQKPRADRWLGQACGQDNRDLLDVLACKLEKDKPWRENQSCRVNTGGQSPLKQSL